MSVDSIIKEIYSRVTFPTIISSRSEVARSADIGMSSIYGRAVTATLFVSPNGDGTDGLTINTAYQTIQAALDAASVNVNDHTMILISPGTYDIDQAGDPTWSANVTLAGVYGSWVRIVNNNAGATSIMKLTGLAGLYCILFDLGTSNNGLILTHSGIYTNRCVFSGENLTAAKTGLEIGDGITIAEWGKLVETYVIGEATRTHLTGIKLNKSRLTFIIGYEVALANIALYILNAASDTNVVNHAEIDLCTTGIQIDAGDGQWFDAIRFGQNTTNVNDSVNNHHWFTIGGQLPAIYLPDDLTGVAVTAGAGANNWGANTQILSAVSRTKPFRILEVGLEPAAGEKYKVRLYDGTNYFNEVAIEGAGLTVVRGASSVPSGTEFIFNKGTAISASAKSETGGNNIAVWLKVQEI